MTVWHNALGAQPGFGELLLSRPHNQGHTISQKITTVFPALFDGTCQRVEVTTIDRISENSTSSIWKLDVEGMEADVIRGARRTLECSPPRVVLVEAYDQFVDEVVRLLPEFKVKRAALARTDYSLQLLDQIGGELTEEFCRTSPMYVFMRITTV
jgi:hypothetical protein